VDSQRAAEQRLREKLAAEQDERTRRAASSRLSAVRQALGGTRSNLAALLNVERRVLDLFGDLVSLVGTHRTARKIDHKHELRDLTSVEHY
jgi:hypothetical protein